MVAVGVTGHRVLKNQDAVLQAIDLALECIQQSFPNETYAVVSPLAEGADRLVAQRAMESLSAQLIVPLPLEISEYMQDFETSVSKAEFKSLVSLAHQVVQLPDADTRTAGYLAAGRYTLQNCDVLVAVWDGQQSGRTGGTGQIVTEARQREIPLAWIQVSDRRQWDKTPSGREDDNIRVQYERFPLTKAKAGDP